MKLYSSGRRGMTRYFKKFNDIDGAYLLTDKHIHSQWSDGKATVQQIVERASEIGLGHIAITDHFRRSSGHFEEYRCQIRKIAQRSPVRILAGFEVKVADFKGAIDASSDQCKRAELRIASVHRFPIGRRMVDPDKFSEKQCQEIELELSVAALKKGRFDVLGHPGGMSMRTYGAFPAAFFEEIISECNKAGVAFDLSASYHRQTLNKLKPLLKKYNPFISLSSDAHCLEDVGSCAGMLESDL